MGDPSRSSVFRPRRGTYRFEFHGGFLRGMRSKYNKYTLCGIPPAFLFLGGGSPCKFPWKLPRVPWELRRIHFKPSKFPCNTCATVFLVEAFIASTEAFIASTEASMLPWKFTRFHGSFHGRFHGSLRGCPWKLIPRTLPRKFAEASAEASMDARGSCFHGSFHGSFRKIPRKFP